MLCVGIDVRKVPQADIQAVLTRVCINSVGTTLGENQLALVSAA